MLTPELQKPIQELSLTQLNNLSEALLDFSSVPDLEALLQQLSREIE